MALIVIFVKNSTYNTVYNFPTRREKKREQVGTKLHLLSDEEKGKLGERRNYEECIHCNYLPNGSMLLLLCAHPMADEKVGNITESSLPPSHKFFRATYNSIKQVNIFQTIHT